MITSSAMRERSTASIAVTKLNSATTSRGSCRVDRVLARSVEAELDRHCVRIKPERGSRQRSGAIGRTGRPGVPVAQPIDVAGQRPRVREQVVGQQDGLSVLHVGSARHGDASVALGLVGKRRDEGQHLVRQQAGLLAQVHPDQRRDLVVARPAGPQPPAEFGSGPIEQAAFERGVHVLVLGRAG